MLIRRIIETIFVQPMGFYFHANICTSPLSSFVAIFSFFMHARLCPTYIPLRVNNSEVGWDDAVSLALLTCRGRFPAGMHNRHIRSLCCCVTVPRIIHKYKCLPRKTHFPNLFIYQIFFFIFDKSLISEHSNNQILPHVAIVKKYIEVKL